MCDARTEQLVRDTVDGFIQKGYMFTAYDVTRFLRKSGERIRHSDVNDVVKVMHANSQMGQYTRDTKDVGAPVAPFVYYHPYSDLANYDQNWVDNNPTQNGMKNDTQDGTPSQVPPVAVPTTPAGCHAGIPNATPSYAQVVPQGVSKVTKEGRLQIPINVVRMAGFTPNQNVVIAKGNGSLVIKELTSFTGKPEAKVESDGRIRICRQHLDNISNGDLFKVEQQNNEIVVLPA